jgi:hypothetical protein
MHMSEHGDAVDGRRSLPSAGIGLGADLGLLSRTMKSADGAIADLVFRADVLAPGGGLGVETTWGIARAGGGPFTSIGSAGIFWSLYFLDVGYTYTFPLDVPRRPAWVPSHAFSLRIQFPIDGT